MDDPEDPEWKVIVDKAPRSKRHEQADDDEEGPNNAEHIFDTPGLRNPLTSGL